MRTCHYIILAIEKNASEADIKKAYRKKALEWHPDKNHHRVEEATKEFALIAEAYEVLSDPQERAWYDSHRDAILRGDDKSTGESEGVAGTTSSDLMKYFSSSIYKGFQDNQGGFFAVFKHVFDMLAKEEEEAVDMERSSSDVQDFSVHYPSFGCSSTPYDDNSDSDVKQFYNAWLTFSSQKSFSWCDKFRLSEAPHRYARRQMEKENKKFRDAARKEFNDTVLSLAAYVKKRDPRFAKYQAQQKQKQEAVQAEAKARAEKEKERIRLLAEQFQEQAWSKVEEENDDSGSSDDGDEEEHAFECIVCEKYFKSERQWKNHERSKKHLKILEEIRQEMLEDEELILQGDDGNDEGINESFGVDEEHDGMEEYRFDHQASVAIDLDDAGADLEQEEPKVSLMYGSLKSKKKNKKKKVLDSALELEDHELENLDQDGLADLLGSVRLSARAKTLSPMPAAVSDLGSPMTRDAFSDITTPTSTAPGSRAESPNGTKKLSGKAKKKARSELAAQKASANPEFRCHECKADHDTRNQLFSHIRESGHAQAISSDEGAKGKNKRGKRK